MTRNSVLLSLLIALAGCRSSDDSEEAKTLGLQEAVQFNASAGELPEGLAIVGNTAYVGFAPTGQVVQVDLATSEVSAYGQLPTPVPNLGFMTGLASKGDTLYAALVSFTPEVQAGVYEIPASGGEATLFASHEAMAFPNAIIPDGNALFVTDSGSGSIFKIEAGAVTPWIQSDVLVGDQNACPGGAGFDIGVNGMVVEPDAVYGVNTDKGSLIRIPRLADGSAGEPEVLAGPDCGTLAGADGLVRDGDSFLVAVNRQDAITRVSSNGRVEKLILAGSLDFPATLVSTGSGFLGTNFAFLKASSGGAATPGLFRLER
ncbi:MAG: hypothetical protein KC492_14260 [Myxococcales bacterium]|nr:hypothetical protein [Myxococcales bacterium]